MSQIDALINLCYPSQIFPLQSLYNGKKIENVALDLSRHFDVF